METRSKVIPVTPSETISDNPSLDECVNIVYNKDRFSVSFDSLTNNREPIRLSWRNIRYSVQIKASRTGICCGKKERKIILNNVSGNVSAGKLCAILGPSGSGKTSLLKIISNTLIYKKGNKLTGNVFINGINRKSLGNKTFSKLSGIVQQTNYLFNHQTVYETLMTAAKFNVELKTKQQKHNVVESILCEFDLLHIANTKIGDDKIRGISGGEKKRVVIAIALIKNPSLLFLDEPTSGLDSYQALKVIGTLKKLCDNGCTIILSIHQARSAIFKLFDLIYLLSQNGQTVYHGLSGNVSLQYFQQRHHICPQYFNPADFFLDLISIDRRSCDTEEKSIKRIETLVNQFKAENVSNEDINKHNKDIIKFRRNNMSNNVSNNVSVAKQLTALLVRSYRQILRNKRSFLLRLLPNILFGFVTSIVYADINGSIVNTTNLFVFIAVLQLTGNTTQTIPAFWLEKSIIMSEVQEKSYSLFIYYIVTLISTMPFLLIYNLTLAIILYIMVGLRNDAVTFAYFILITVLQNLCSIGIGFACSAMPITLSTISALGNFIIGLNVLFSGMVIDVHIIPNSLRWISNISTMRWSVIAYSINEFKHDKIVCHPNNNKEAECLWNGHEILEVLHFDQYTLQFTLMALSAILVVIHLFAFIMLRKNINSYMNISTTKCRNDEKKNIKTNSSKSLSIIDEENNNYKLKETEYDLTQMDTDRVEHGFD